MADIRAPFDANQMCATAGGHLLAIIESEGRSIPMMDVVMLAIGFVFFALSIAYVYACDQL